MDSLINTFGIQLGALIGYSIDFFILLFVLQKFTYKPLLKYLEERRKKIEHDAQLSVEITQRKEQIDQEYAQAMKKAQTESDHIIERAREIAGQMEEKIVSQAHEQAQQIEAKMKKQMAQERQEMYEALKEEVSGLVVAVTRKLIAEELPAQKQERIVQESIREYEEGKGTKTI